VAEPNAADDLEFHISSFSGGGNCLAVAKLPTGEYALRHSRNTEMLIVMTPGEWTAFLKGAKACEFDF
jgi:hypothetical protein